jgi:hypothetical protein
VYYKSTVLNELQILRSAYINLKKLQKLIKFSTDLNVYSALLYANIIHIQPMTTIYKISIEMYLPDAEKSWDPNICRIDLQT